MSEKEPQPPTKLTFKSIMGRVPKNVDMNYSRCPSISRPTNKHSLNACNGLFESQSYSLHKREAILLETGVPSQQRTSPVLLASSSSTAHDSMSSPLKQSCTPASLDTAKISSCRNTTEGACVIVRTSASCS